MVAVNNEKKNFPPLLFLLLASSLLIAEYPEVVFSDFTFFFRDFGIFSYPDAYYLRECFLHQELPQWNPLNEFGLPFLAQWNTMTLYPGNLLLLIFPIQWSLAVFNLVHLIFGATGMYLLAKQITGNNFAAAVAGIGYEFNGVTLNSLMWCNNIAALGWMPYTIISSYNAMQQKTRKSVIIAIIIAAIQILTGAPEIIGISWLIIIGFMGVEIFSQNKINLSSIVTTLIVLIGAITLTLVQTLPFYQLLSNSHRYIAGGDSSWALSSPLNLIAPLLNTFQWNYGVFFQKDQYWTSSTYISLTVVWLAIAGSIYGKTRLKIIAVLFALVGIFLSMGNNSFLYPLATRISGILELIRFPVKFIILSVFLIPLLAAFGLTQILNINSRIDRKKIATLFLIAIGLIVAVAICSNKGFASEQSGGIQKNYFIKNTGLRTLFLSLSIGLIYGATYFKKASKYLFIFLIIIIFLDIKTHLPRQNPTVENWVYSPQLLADERPAGFKNGRILTRHDKDFTFISISNDAALEMISKRLGLFSNLNLLEGFSKTTGMFSLHIATTAAILSRIYDNGIFIPSPLADFLSIHWMVRTNKQYEWIERKSHLPIVNFSRNIVRTNDLAAFNLIFSQEFNPESVVYIPDNMKVNEHLEFAVPKIEIIDTKPNKIIFKTISDKPAIITISQSFYPSWKASIDKQKIEILRANYGFQAIIVPEGEHIVTLFYQDKYFITGLLLSIFSLTLIIVLIKQQN